jgi:cytochrome c-type biogenesis protein CcmH/NrfG
LTLASASQFDRSLESAEAAARADPNLAEPHLLLGGLLARKRQLPEAAREYQEAIRLRPDFARARLDLASVLVEQGDTRGAVQQLREAAKSSDPEVARLAAAALQRLGER